MLKTIFTIFISIIVIILGIFLAIGSKIYRTISSLKRGAQRNSQQGNRYNSTNSKYNHTNSTQNSSHSSEKQVIGKDEGEYVEFEEIASEEK